MRQVLVDHARKKSTKKRGSGRARVALEDHLALSPRSDTDVLALNDVLERLALIDERRAKMVEMRFFGGMSVEDCATTLGISVRTVHYEWAHARAWLRGQLEGV